MEDFADVWLGQHVIHRAEMLESAVLQHQHFMSIFLYEREVVEDDDDSCIILFIKMLKNIHHLKLISDVQVGERFIEQDDRRLLGHSAGIRLR